MPQIRKLPLLVASIGMLSASVCLAQTDGDEPVTVTTANNGMVLQGSILSFDTDTLTIKSDIGVLVLPREGLSCVGAACPAPVDASSDISAAVTDPALVELLRAMTDRFAEGQGLTALALPSPDGRLERINILETSPGDATFTGLDLQVLPPLAAKAALSSGDVDLSVGAATPTAPVPASVLAHSHPADTMQVVLALDALVPVVHPSNPVGALSIAQLAGIITGRISNWSQLGGADRDIEVVLPAYGTTQAQAIERLILAPARMRMRPQEWGNVGQDIIQQVRTSPGRIALVRLDESTDLRTVPLRQVCGPLAAPTQFAIKAEEYPLTYRILGESTVEGDFVSFLGTDSAQDVAQVFGLVDHSIVTAPLDGQGGRMTSAVLTAESGVALEDVQRFARSLVGAERLSTTFRYTSNNLALDSKGKSDLVRVVEYLTRSENAERDVLVLGFSDAVGRYDLNQRIAQEAALALTNAILSAPGGAALAQRLETNAYGPLAPVGCNDTEQGRQANRRVEIWVK